MAVAVNDRYTAARVRDRQLVVAVKMRREGCDWDEIHRKLDISVKDLKAIVAERLPTHLEDSKPWHVARRTRLLAKQERDQSGPVTHHRRHVASVEACRAGDMPALIGALEDEAAGLIAWIVRLERQKTQILPR